MISLTDSEYKNHRNEVRYIYIFLLKNSYIILYILWALASLSHEFLLVERVTDFFEISNCLSMLFCENGKEERKLII